MGPVKCCTAWWWSNLVKFNFYKLLTSDLVKNVIVQAMFTPLPSFSLVFCWHLFFPLLLKGKQPPSFMGSSTPSPSLSHLPGCLHVGGGCHFLSPYKETDLFYLVLFWNKCKGSYSSCCLTRHREVCSVYWFPLLTSSYPCYIIEEGIGKRCSQWGLMSQCKPAPVHHCLIHSWPER